jgi:hypothetical protein
MTGLGVDRLVFPLANIDREKSPLAEHFDIEDYVLDTFNQGPTVLPSGNHLKMVPIAEALRRPIFDGKIHAIRWDDGRYVLDGWPLELAKTRGHRHQPRSADRGQCRADRATGGSNVRARRCVQHGYRRCCRSLHRGLERGRSALPEHPYCQGLCGVRGKRGAGRRPTGVEKQPTNTKPFAV